MVAMKKEAELERMTKEFFYLHNNRVEYYNLLLKRCSEVTKLDFSSFEVVFPQFPVGIHLLEGFIHKNKLFDTNSVFKAWKDQKLAKSEKGEK